MALQELFREILTRLSAPEFAAIFLGLVAVLFVGIHLVTGGRPGRSIHKLVGLVLSIGLALILLAASLGAGYL